MNTRKAIITAAAAAGIIFAAGTAHADNSTFIPDLQAQGVPAGSPIMPDPMGGGYTVCGWIRGGMNPGDAAAAFHGWDRPYAGTFVATAQRDLCPDTLR